MRQEERDREFAGGGGGLLLPAIQQSSNILHDQWPCMVSLGLGKCWDLA